MHSKKVLLSSQAFRHLSLETRYEAQSVEQYILFIRISAENPQMPASKWKKRFKYNIPRNILPTFANRFYKTYIYSFLGDIVSLSFKMNKN